MPKEGLDDAQVFNSKPYEALGFAGQPTPAAIRTRGCDWRDLEEFSTVTVGTVSGFIWLIWVWKAYPWAVWTYRHSPNVIMMNTLLKLR